MTDKQEIPPVVQIFMCGPSNAKCICKCAEGGPCEHKWDGPWVESEDEGEVTCSKCGMGAMHHSLWSSP